MVRRCALQSLLQLELWPALLSKHRHVAVNRNIWVAVDVVYSKNCKLRTNKYIISDDNILRQRNSGMLSKDRIITNTLNLRPFPKLTPSRMFTFLPTLGNINLANTNRIRLPPALSGILAQPSSTVAVPNLDTPMPPLFSICVFKRMFQRMIVHPLQ